MNDGLRKDYQAAMDYLYVYDDMYSRVLQNVTETMADQMNKGSKAVKSGYAMHRNKKNKTCRRIRGKILRFAPVIAAAAAVLVVLAVIPEALRPKLTQEESGTEVTVSEQDGVYEESAVPSADGASAEPKESSGDDIGSADTQTSDAEINTGADAGSSAGQNDTAAESSINDGLASAESAEESVADGVADQEAPSQNSDTSQDAAADADGAAYQEARTYSAEITDLHNRISEAMGKGLLPFVVSCGIYENPDRVVVTVTTRDEDSIKLLESYNTGNVQMEIQYTGSVANAD